MYIQKKFACSDESWNLIHHTYVLVRVRFLPTKRLVPIKHLIIHRPMWHYNILGVLGWGSWVFLGPVLVVVSLDILVSEKFLTNYTDFFVCSCLVGQLIIRIVAIICVGFSVYMWMYPRKNFGLIFLAIPTLFRDGFK